MCVLCGEVNSICVLCGEAKHIKSSVVCIEVKGASYSYIASKM